MGFDEFLAEVDNMTCDSALRIEELGAVFESMENILDPLIERGGYDAVTLSELKRLSAFVRIAEGLRSQLYEGNLATSAIVTLSRESA